MPEIPNNKGTQENQLGRANIRKLMASHHAPKVTATEVAIAQKSLNTDITSPKVATQSTQPAPDKISNSTHSKLYQTSSYDERQLETGAKTFTPIADRALIHTDLTVKIDGKDHCYGHETVIRSDTTTILRATVDAKVTDLKERIRKSKLPAGSLRHLVNELATYQRFQKTLANTPEGAGSWAGSGSFRRLIETARTTPRTDAAGKLLSSDEKIEMVLKEFLPLTVNMRLQKLTLEDGSTSSFVRSGAITDPRDGGTSLKQLKGELSKLRGNNRNELEIQALESRIIDRQAVLECQVLQELAAHASLVAPSEVQSDTPLVLCRTSLLNGNKPAADKGGQILNERNQIEDMMEIFDYIDGKELCFDGKGPYIDGDGLIHLPVEHKDDKGAPILKTLDAIFMNISVSGSASNTGPQKEANQQAFEKINKTILGRLGTDPGNVEKHLHNLSRLVELQEEIEKGAGEDPHMMSRATELTKILASDYGVKITFNCFSGKDRTGWIAADFSYAMLSDSIDEKSSLSPKKKRKAKRKIARMLEATALEVCRDNGVDAVKLTIARIPGMQVLPAFKRIQMKNHKIRSTAGTVEGLWKAGYTFVSSGEAEGTIDNPGKGR